MPANVAIEPRMLLNDREADILRLMAEGANYEEIQEGIHFSYSSVKRHRHNLYQKIGATNALQAVLWYHDVGRETERQSCTDAQITVLGEPMATILSQIAYGDGTAEIVTVTHYSADSVKRFIQRMYTIIGVCSREQAALWFHNKPILFCRVNSCYALVTA